ncbi:hypothetical protein BDV41DRAFT_572449 [Aspergillus transmontanensis]|uniref:RING-type domain-containing protein n=1 Tax=Aspergillus transmontanensis TaxID=1034304 RepID=A0A5N6WAV7_9EURO|nr:hypothetical protein BDV41DRAFT_572449 [Aspergillus transmontanensis]
MPSQARLPLDLAEILDIYPLFEDRCQYFSLSRFRRCKNRISPASRPEALRLLDLGMKYLTGGQDIEYILRDLASVLLCTQRHQSRVSRLAGNWSNEVWSKHRSLQKQWRAEAKALRSNGVRGPMQQTEQTQQAPVEERRPQQQPSGRIIPTRCWEEPANRVNETSVSMSSGLGQAARVSNTSVVSGMVVPRAVEGDCGICLLGFLVDVTGGSAREYTAAEKKLYETNYDYHRWVWCRNHCGTNYHRDCMNRWIRSSVLYPKCPTCNRFWIY